MTIDFHETRVDDAPLLVIDGARDRSIYERWFKRPLDIVTSAALLVVLAPLMALVALGVVVTMGRPIIFRQERLTRGGVPFTMYKFRSMLAEDHAPDDADDESEFHAAADSPRHTPRKGLETWFNVFSSLLELLFLTFLLYWKCALLLTTASRGPITIQGTQREAAHAKKVA